MRQHRSSACVGIRSFALLTLALLATVGAAPARADEDWTCTGATSASCVIGSGVGNCAPSNQGCFQHADPSLGSGGCYCRPACDSNASCPDNEICYKGHCWNSFPCNDDPDCPAGSVCKDGTCQQPGPVDCNRSDDPSCTGDPCQPRRWDAAAKRCVRTDAPRPCADIAEARCIAASASEFRCYVPACTSDEQCNANGCVVDGRCDQHTGHCIPGRPACGEGETCWALFGNRHQCLVTAQREPREREPSRVVITQPDLTLIPGDSGSPGAGSGRFVLAGRLPAAALAKPGPGALSLRVARDDRALLVDDVVTVSTSTGVWKPLAGSRGWSWKANDEKSAIDGVTVQPVERGKGAWRFEVRGRTLPVAGADASDPAASAYAAIVELESEAGADAVRGDASFGSCISSLVDGAKAVVCHGKPEP